MMETEVVATVRCSTTLLYYSSGNAYLKYKHHFNLQILHVWPHVHVCHVHVCTK